MIQSNPVTANSRRIIRRIARVCNQEADWRDVSCSAAGSIAIDTLTAAHPHPTRNRLPPSFVPLLSKPPLAIHQFRQPNAEPLVYDQDCVLCPVLPQSLATSLRRPH